MRTKEEIEGDLEEIECQICNEEADGNNDRLIELSKQKETGKGISVMGTVKKTYDIDEEALENKSTNSAYLASCYEFYQKVKDKEANELSEKQLKWLMQIEEMLMD